MRLRRIDSRDRDVEVVQHVLGRRLTLLLAGGRIRADSRPEPDETYLGASGVADTHERMFVNIDREFPHGLRLAALIQSQADRDAQHREAAQKYFQSKRHFVI